MAENENVDRRVAASEKPMEFVPFGSDQKIKLTVSIVKSVCCTPTKSGRRCSDSDALKFMMLCQALGLNPFANDAYLVGYDSNKDGVIVPTFSLITAHQALLKRAEIHPEYDGMESGIVIRNEAGTIEERQSCFIMDGEEVLGGWAKVFRKSKRPSYSKLAMSQRKPKYPSQFWEGSKAAEQIQKCAEADAMRLAFPTKIGGLFLREEMDFPINIDSTVTEIPMNRLVATTDEPADDHQTTQQDGAQTSQEPPSEVKADQKVNPVQAKANSPQDKLGRFCAENQVTFDQFQKWALESENVAGADSIEGFAGVPTVDAERLMRAPKAMLHQIRGAKPAEKIEEKGK